MKHGPLFITFEGPEGAGKSTQVRHLAAKLTATGIETVVTREPGGTPASDAIRRVILDPQLEMNALTEFLLYAASRAQHVDAVIAPALAAGKTVLSDRFAAASVAYQGYGRGLELGFIDTLSARVTQGLRPGLTILLDLDPHIGLERVAERGHPDRLEQADLEFHLRVRAGFRELAQADHHSWVVFDALQAEKALAAAIWETVRTRLFS